MLKGFLLNARRCDNPESQGSTVAHFLSAMAMFMPFFAHWDLMLSISRVPRHFSYTRGYGFGLANLASIIRFSKIQRHMRHREGLYLSGSVRDYITFPSQDTLRLKTVDSAAC